jgi:hypothetical protein
VSTEVRQRELTGWTPAESYSEFAALIEVQRRATFYMWTVFAPVMLIFLISCTIFVVHIENFHDRIAISLTALLACVAMQFTVQAALLANQPERAMRLDRFAGLGLPALFFALIVLCMIW